MNQYETLLIVSPRYPQLWHTTGPSRPSSLGFSFWYIRNGDSERQEMDCEADTGTVKYNVLCLRARELRSLATSVARYCVGRRDVYFDDSYTFSVRVPGVRGVDAALQHHRGLKRRYTTI